VNNSYISDFLVEMEKISGPLVFRPWLRNVGRSIKRAFVKDVEPAAQAAVKTFKTYPIRQEAEAVAKHVNQAPQFHVRKTPGVSEISQAEINNNLRSAGRGPTATLHGNAPAPAPAPAASAIPIHGTTHGASTITQEEINNNLRAAGRGPTSTLHAHVPTAEPTPVAAAAAATPTPGTHGRTAGVKEITPEEVNRNLKSAGRNPAAVPTEQNNNVVAEKKKPGFWKGMGTAAKIGIGGGIAAGALGAGGVAYGAMRTPTDIPEPYGQ